MYTVSANYSYPGVQITEMVVFLLVWQSQVYWEACQIVIFNDNKVDLKYKTSSVSITLMQDKNSTVLSIRIFNIHFFLSYYLSRSLHDWVGSCSIDVANLKSIGKSSCALGYMSL